MKISAVVGVLKNVPVFSSLSDVELKRISENGIRRSYAAGEKINTDKSIVVILKGSVYVTKQIGGKKLLMRTLGTGGISGVASLFSGDAETVSTLTAVKSTYVLIISQETVSELIETNGKFAKRYILFLTSRIRFLNERIKAYTCSGAESRLAFHLLMSDECEKGEVELGVSFSKLAVMLDIGRASLYRAMDSLSEKGIISRTGRKITINDFRVLKSIANGV